MSKDLYVERLRAVPLFASLSKKETALLLRQSDPLRYPPRFRIVREGAAGEDFWMVLDGTFGRAPRQRQRRPRGRAPRR